MYFKTTIWYPITKTDDIGKKFLEVSEKYPDDESIGEIVVRAAVSAVKRRHPSLFSP